MGGGGAEPLRQIAQELWDSLSRIPKTPSGRGRVSPASVGGGAWVSADVFCAEEEGLRRLLKRRKVERGRRGTGAGVGDWDVAGDGVEVDSEAAG